MSNHYTYRAEWSPEDNEYVGLVAEFPSLSWLASTATEAVAGASQLVDNILADMAETGETPPVPLTERRYSGNLSFRTSPAQHRALAIEAAEQNVSVNQLLIYKTALGIHNAEPAGAEHPPAKDAEAFTERGVFVVEHRVKADTPPAEALPDIWRDMPEDVRSKVFESVRKAVLDAIPHELSAPTLLLKGERMKEAIAAAYKFSGVTEALHGVSHDITIVPPSINIPIDLAFAEDVTSPKGF